MSSEYHEDGVIRDMADAMEWADTGLARLREEMDCMTGHWGTFMEVCEGAPENPDEVSQEIANEAAGNIYALIAHATAMSQHFYEYGRIVFDWIAPGEVKHQLMMEVMERMTGQPVEIVGGGPGFSIVQTVPIEVPDDISKLDGDNE